MQFANFLLLQIHSGKTEDFHHNQHWCPFPPIAEAFNRYSTARHSSKNIGTKWQRAKGKRKSG
jgi:hypothetical protein